MQQNSCWLLASFCRNLRHSLFLLYISVKSTHNSFLLNLSSTYHESHYLVTKKTFNKIGASKRGKEGEESNLWKSKIVFFFSVRVMEVDTFKQISTLENGIEFWVRDRERACVRACVCLSTSACESLRKRWLEVVCVWECVRESERARDKVCGKIR